MEWQRNLRGRTQPHANPGTLIAPGNVQLGYPLTRFPSVIDRVVKGGNLFFSGQGCSGLDKRSQDGNCNEPIRKALFLAAELEQLAETGYSLARDDSCIQLYGTVRDCAFRIRQAAQAEAKRHRAAGVWSSEDPLLPELDANRATQ